MKYAVLISLVAASAACVSALPHPTEADARVAAARFDGVTLAELDVGRRSYVASCAGCHHLYLPADRPPDAWPPIVAEMSARGSVSSADSRAIERYLVTMASPR